MRNGTHETGHVLVHWDHAGRHLRRYRLGMKTKVRVGRCIVLGLLLGVVVRAPMGMGTPPAPPCPGCAIIEPSVHIPASAGCDIEEVQGGRICG